MIKYLAIPLILVGCTAPVTDPPAHAFELEIEESHWDNVYTMNYFHYAIINIAFLNSLE